MEDYLHTTVNGDLRYGLLRCEVMRLTLLLAVDWAWGGGTG